MWTSRGKIFEVVEVKEVEEEAASGASGLDGAGGVVGTVMLSGFGSGATVTSGFLSASLAVVALRRFRRTFKLRPDHEVRSGDADLRALVM